MKPGIEPASSATLNDQISELARLIRDRQPITVLTGAGLSASSGLPVYRDDNGNWIHSEPVQGPKFRASEKMRRRYWCRSYFGWQSFSVAKPNTAHFDLVAMEQNNLVSTVITQNVDGLHQRAGSTGTIALHGNLSEVICLDCGDITQRSDLQRRLHENNPEFVQIDFSVAPDGDAIVEDDHIARFTPVNCSKCYGTLQPYVVFYGDNVPKPRVDECMQRVLGSGALLCIGTSLMVFSSYRFCKAAKEADVPIVIINSGVTRADDIASMTIRDDCADVLAKLKAELL